MDCPTRMAQDRRRRDARARPARGWWDRPRHSPAITAADPPPRSNCRGQGGQDSRNCWGRQPQRHPAGDSRAPGDVPRHPARTELGAPPLKSAHISCQLRAASALRAVGSRLELDLRICFSVRLYGLVLAHRRRTRIQLRPGRPVSAVTDASACALRRRRPTRLHQQLRWLGDRITST
jgi:hypothetical protein